MKIKLLLIAFSFITLSLINSGCKEKSVNNTNTKENYQSAEDNSLVESEFSSVFESVDDQASSNKSLSGIAEKDDSPNIQKVEGGSILSECTKVTIDSAKKLLTIDFGSTNCLCKDGLYRRGKIFAQFNDKYRKIGSKVVVTLQDYYVQDMNVQGSKTIERVDTAKWNITITNASITTPTGTISWNANRTIEKIAGFDTWWNIWDDVYLVSGSASGVNRQGIKFTVSIDQPLKKKIALGCFRYFVSGIWTLKNENGFTMVMNYDPIGGEPCDRTAEVTINGKKYTITLR